MNKSLAISIVLLISTSSLFAQLFVSSTGKKKYETTISSNLSLHSLKVKVEAPGDNFTLTEGGSLEIRDISYLFEIQLLNVKVRNIRSTLGFDIVNNRLQTQLNGLHVGVGYNILSKENLELYTMYTFHLAMTESKWFSDPNVDNSFFFHNPSINEFSLNMEYCLGPKKITYLLLCTGFSIAAKTLWETNIDTSPYFYLGGGGPTIRSNSVGDYTVDFAKSFFVGVGLGINLASEN